MRISDWSSDVCSSDLIGIPTTANIGDGRIYTVEGRIAIRPAPRLTLDGSIIYNDSRLSRPAQFLRQIGRASCRERVCQYVSISGVRVSFKKKNSNKNTEKISTVHKNQQKQNTT